MATTTEEEQKKLQEEQAQGQAQGAATGTQEEEPAVKYEPITAKHVEAPAPDPSQSAYAQYMANYPKYDEEEEQRRLKRARSAMLLGAISDGISAMSNLYATKRYAPSAMNAKSTTLSDRAKKIYDEVEKTRQANRKAWQQGADKAAALRQKDVQNANKTKLDVEKFNAAQDLKAEQFNATLPGKEATTNANVGKAKAQTAKTNSDAENNTAVATARVGQLNASEDAQNALANKRNAEASGGSSGGSGSGSGSGSGKKFRYRDEGGWKEADTEAERKGRVLAAAERAGIRTGSVFGDNIDYIAGLLENYYDNGIDVPENMRIQGKYKPVGGASTSSSDDNTEHTWSAGASGNGNTGHTWGKKK